MKCIQTRRGGFTLIELLVVMAIISLLLSIITPALRRTKELGTRAVCLNNTKSLTTCWMLYIQDSDALLPRAQAVAPSDTSTVNSWVAQTLDHAGTPVRLNIAETSPVENQLRAIQQGQLFPYIQNTHSYRCPVAKPTEMRTYSMTHAMNGAAQAEQYGGKVLKRFSEMRSTVNRIVFLDDYADNWDAAWMVYNDRPQWWNTTPIRHGGRGGNVFSFADGHSEWWDWEDRRTIELARQCFDAGTPDARSFPTSLQSDNPDLIKAQRGVWGALAY